ncbi:MAG: hypothetical protein GY814_00075 [Gammaproteobacteria bacterium]|nr:hypothetical protein [Gammaproteobacteria bacterium]
MAQIRLAVAVVAATIAMSSLTITGCSSRDTGKNYSNGEAPETGEMVADAAVVRPMTLWASAIGAVGWVVTLPFTLPSGSAGDVGKAWVGDPLKYTFCRPIGEMEDNSDERCFDNGDGEINDNVKR